jgi:hypothetical protein
MKRDAIDQGQLVTAGGSSSRSSWKGTGLDGANRVAEISVALNGSSDFRALIRWVSVAFS